MPATTINVSTAAGFVAALRSAKGGETILLASGNYGDINIGHINPTSNVTIKSANPDNDAVFTALRLTSVSNLTFDDVDVSRAGLVTTRTDRSTVVINGGKNITLVGVDINGSLNNNCLDDAMGLTITGSKNVAVLDSTFRQVGLGCVIGTSEDVIFAGNTITDARSGVSIGQLKGGLFDRNYMTDMFPNYSEGYHPDFFQLHGGDPKSGITSDIKFSNNVMVQGDSGFIGGIFIAPKARGTWFTNIEVSNNYYEGAYRHAISVNQVENLKISDNTILQADYKGLAPAILFSEVKNALIEDNITPLLLNNKPTTSSNVTLKNNIDVWDAGYKKGIAASALFADSDHNTLDFSQFNPLANSVATSAGVGFRAVAGIGDLIGGSTALLAAYLPQFDHNFVNFH